MIHSVEKSRKMSHSNFTNIFYQKKIDCFQVWYTVLENHWNCLIRILWTFFTRKVEIDYFQFWYTVFDNHQKCLIRIFTWFFDQNYELNFSNFPVNYKHNLQAIFAAKIQTIQVFKKMAFDSKSEFWIIVNFRT